MTGHRVSGAALAVTALALALAAEPASVSAKPRADCTPAKSRTVAENRAVRVYTDRYSDEGLDVVRLVGCVRSTRRRTALAYDYDDTHESGSFDLVRLRGVHVAYHLAFSSGDCRGDCGPDYDPTSEALEVVDLRSHRRVTVGTTAYPAAGRLLLDAHGAIAWPVRASDGTVALHVRDAEGARVVDRGQIPPVALRLTAGGQLRWTNAGAARAARLRHRVSTASTLGAPLALTPFEERSFAGRATARIVVDPAGTAIVTWTALPHVRFAARPTGGFFAPPFGVLRGVGRTEQPDLSLDRDGNAIAVWLRAKGQDYRVQAATRSAAGILSSPVDLGMASGFFVAPRAALSPTGEAVVVWNTREALEEGVVRAAVRPAGGAFAAPITLAPGVDPRVAMDAAGNAVVVWRAATGPNTSVVAAATRPAGGRFSAPVTLSGGAMPVPPELAVDGAGDALAVWLHTDGARTSLRAAERPAGGAFRSSVELPATTGAQSLRLAMNPAGAAIVAWQTDDGAFASRRTAGGAFSTPQSVATGLRRGALSGAAIGPSGAAVVTWVADDGLSAIVRAALAPPADGFTSPIDVSPSGTSATRPSVGIDAAGRATFAWVGEDNRPFVAGRDITGRPVGQTALAGLRVSPSRFRAGSRGVRVRYALSVRARVRLTLERGFAGRAGGPGAVRCDKPSAANRDNFACTRYRPMLGGVTRTGAAGARSVALPWRGLRPGPYRLTTVPVSSGRRGTISRAVFRVLP